MCKTDIAGKAWRAWDFRRLPIRICKKATKQSPLDNVPSARGAHHGQADGAATARASPKKTVGPVSGTINLRSRDRG